MRFWLPWVIAATVTAVAIYYFLAGLVSGSVSSFNMGIWILILLGTTGVTACSMILKLHGRPGLAAIVALILALPGLVAVLFLLLMVVTQPSWT
jgi:hypothetical protein